ncbi:MAG: bifunctional 4-hydroxy-2-oxoglutarate aldolase/2-dehydro-3-deoxy-phosphogluconate aldolase [Chloroflexota bacterium]|nr:bifunctional 4-hydroxy-2-oxoglutarate aldolase/2-dehydro-3-deoxy-phosphogluconate aldolase [Chloroflexota bacterium]
MSAVVEMVERARLVAVIRLPDLSGAADLTRALLAGGVTVLEFTLTNRDAITVIRDLRHALPEFDRGEAAIGAGSVTTIDGLNQVIDAGAQFVVSPIMDPALIARARAAGIVSMPGAYTPTEIFSAHQHGAEFVKVFPIRALGAAYLKDVLAPLPDLRLIAVGGVDLDNMAGYLSSGAVAVGVGGNLFDTAAIAAGDWEAVARRARAYADRAAGRA